MKVFDIEKHVHECKYLSNACFRNIHKITGETLEIRSDISDKMKQEKKKRKCKKQKKQKSGLRVIPES